jgi:hypothetical protein
MLSDRINYIVGQNIIPSYLDIFNNTRLNFLFEIGVQLKKNKKIFQSPDLFFLMLWISRKNLLQYKLEYKNEPLRVGRGIILHICPSNVPLNFFYSFTFGLLSGNANIIRIPTKEYQETNILIKVINKVINQRRFAEIKATNIFVKYEKSKSINDYLSSMSDGRIIWGGDQTIKEIKKSDLKLKGIEITFPDKYSFTIINIDKLKKISSNNFNKVVKGFFYDAYTMQQKACNSPHFIFWVGKKDKNTINNFWKNLSDMVEKNNTFQSIDIINKYNFLCEQFIKIKQLNNFINYKNYVYVIDCKENNIEDIRGINGIFYQKFIKNIDGIKKFITTKCQTITYFGFGKNNFHKFIKANNISGIDRIVPVGESMSISLTWDGVDTVKSLSRIIDIK